MFAGRILLTDDERAMRTLLYDILSEYGYMIYSTTESGLHREFFSAEVADAAVLSVHAGEHHAAEVLSECFPPEIPVIVLLPEDQMDMRQVYLDLGAVDVLAKPLDCNILAEKLSRLMPERMKQLLVPMPPYAEFDGISVDLRSGRARTDGMELRLKPRELQLLRLFLVHHGVVMRRYELAAAAWGECMTDEHIVDVHIYALKRALGEPYSRRIVCVRGEGYMMTGKID